MIDPELLLTSVQANVRAALHEDIVGSASDADTTPGDVSAQLIPMDLPGHARVITREPGVFCGRAWVEETANQVDPNIAIVWHVDDGDALEANQTLFELAGAAQSLLTAERTMLNFVQLLSGTATKTAHYVALLEDYDTVLLDTRKTLPGLRIAQKYAVTCGGGQNHRLGLYDAYLLKENHIAAAGSIAKAVANARQANPAMPIEVEVETLAQLREAIDAGADIAMVDNFTLEDTRTAVELAKDCIKLEASGGIDETSITDIAATGVDYISSGDLTKQVDPLDLSMRFLD